MRRPEWRSIAVAIGLLSLTALSLVGKLANQYGFFIYPDSYYYLLIAENLRGHFHPTGTLGPQGMPFPPAGYAVMKVTYPVTVGIALLTGVGAETAGHIVSTGAAVLCVPAAYWAAQRLAASRVVGLTAALFTATSFGLTYWSGFVMSDSLSVLLAFVVLAMAARRRPDRWGNAGDLGTGVWLAALLLSRPTYIVAIPFVAWIGVRRWGWTRTRALTAAAATALVASTAALLWFPPSSFSGKVLGNLAPVLLGVGALAAAALLFARKVSRGGTKQVGEKAGKWLSVMAAGVIVLVYGAERLTDALTTSFYIGLGRFALRDMASLVALLPGSWMLAKHKRWDVAFALNAAALSLLVVYFWAEPRESRYVIHLLPFMIVVASGVALLASPERVKAAWRVPRPVVAIVLSTVVVAGVAAALVAQAGQSITTAKADFLDSAYPREVAERLVGQIPPGSTLLCALPWPYYFHVRHPTWSASVAYADDLGDLLPEDQDVFVLEDASLRFHDRRLARAIAKGRSPVVEFAMPMAYQYGYSAVADPEPVRGYSLSLSELESVVASLAAETETETAGPSGKD